MYRYPVGRGRWIAAAAGITLLIGCVLPWYTAGGQVGNLPAVTGNAFESSGILVFLVALATLALVTLPYAAGDRPMGLDRWPPYLILFAVGLVGVGLAMLARATFEIFQAPQGP